MAYLRQPGFMERLSEYERTRLGQICPPNRYQPGDYLYREGDKCSGLTVMIEGQVKLSRLSPAGQERILFIAGPGDLLGTNFLDENAIHKTDAICMGQVLICPVDKSHIEQVARELPNVTLRLAQVLSERVEHLESQLELSSAPVGLRLGWLWAKANPPAPHRIGLRVCPVGRSIHSEIAPTEFKCARDQLRRALKALHTIPMP